MTMEATTTRVPCPPKALALRLLAAGFQYPDAAWRGRFAALLAECREVSAVAVEDLRFLEREFAETAPDLLEEEHFRLFGPAPACTLDLAHHVDPNPFNQARKIADFAGFYKAFGVESEGRADHLPAVLEFMAYLEIKSAYAGENGWDEKRRIADEAASSLRRDIVVRAMGAFSDKLGKAGAGNFYLRLAAMSRLLGGAL